MNILVARFIRNCLFFLLIAIYVGPSHAQSSEDELISEVDALNDFPEDDEGFASGEPLGLDDLPLDETPQDQAPILGNEQLLDGTSLGLDGPLGPADVTLKGMEFRQLGDRVRLELTMDKVADFASEPRKTRKQIVIELPNAKMEQSFLKRALDTGEFDGPVALVQAFDSRVGSNPSVKVLFQLRDFIEPTITKQGAKIFIDFPMLSGDGTLYRSQAQSYVRPELFISMSDAPSFKGARINLRVKDAPMSDVLNFLSQASGQNFILSEGGEEKVTLAMRNTPWDQVLATILVSKQLGYQKVGNTYRVAKATSLQKELQDSATAKEKEKELIGLETRLYSLSYLNVTEAEKSVTSLLKADKRASITTDARTNSLVITSIPENLERISRYLSSVDRQTPQVQIEARIVEATENLDRFIQHRWGISGFNVPGFKKVFNSDSGSISIPDIATRGTRNLESGSLGMNGSIDLGGAFGSLDAFFDILEKESNIKTIASPKVLASNNEEANLFQGRQAIFVELNSEGEQSVNTYDFTLDLKVKPQVTNDGFVLLDVDLKRDTIGEQVQSSAAAKDRRGIKTKMLVRSGDTSVIGGLYVDDQNETRAGVPWLRKLPIIGRLFEPVMSRVKKRTELLMFISPRIINADSALLKAAAPNVENRDL
ncbi:type IV pilus secretin PilQ [bacterium]|nr:type IV pilus secretin PilQ [bacterium]